MDEQRHGSMTDTTRRTLLGGLAVLGLAAGPASVRAGPKALGHERVSIPLWPGPPPGARAMMPSRSVAQQSKDPAFDDRWITGIAAPSMEVRRPAYRDGSAVLLIPGGGYGFLAWDNEGEEQARWLTARGVTCFILSYRLPCEGWDARAQVPLQDAQRAIRILRSRAAELGIDAARIGVLGFSAGGHLAGSLATRFDEKVYSPIDAADRLDARPDFAGLVYPVVSMSRAFTHIGSRDNLLGKDATEAERNAASIENRVGAATPPLFLAAASDDGLVPITNSLALYHAMLDHNRPVEFHGFDKGGHGFGVRLPSSVPASIWPELFHAAGRRNGIFTT